VIGIADSPSFTSFCVPQNMSKILVSWELGANFGHLTRLIPIAERLHQLGHQLFFAVRDTEVAAALLEPQEFPFTQVKWSN